ncbi:MAG: YbaN family protein [Bacteroidetes bacterium]|nr:YbaN family protein [Bacteroidota bacterium]
MRLQIHLPKPIWITFGIIFVVVGIIGIILPLMPGLVFFILASFCFAKGSPKLLRKLLSHPHIGPQIMDWKRGKGMRVKTKILAIAMVTVSLTISIFYVIQVEYVKWVVLVSMLAIDGYILSVKTRKTDTKIIPLNRKLNLENKSADESDQKIFNSH